MKISEKSNGRILEKWLKFPSSHSDQRNKLMNFTPAFFRRFKDLEPMLSTFHGSMRNSDVTTNSSVSASQKNLDRHATSGRRH